MKTEASMTHIIEWLNQHNINAVNAIGTIVILFLASIIIPILGRFLRHGVFTSNAASMSPMKPIL